MPHGRLRGGDMFAYTHTAVGDGGAVKNRIAITPNTKTIHVRRIALSNSGAAAAGIIIRHADSVSGGTGATEFGFSSNGPTPDALVVTTVTTGTITLTGGETLETIDLAATDREQLLFPRGMVVLNPNHMANNSIAIQVPLGAALTTFTIWWQEEPGAAG